MANPEQQNNEGAGTPESIPMTNEAGDFALLKTLDLSTLEGKKQFASVFRKFRPIGDEKIPKLLDDNGEEVFKNISPDREPEVFIREFSRSYMDYVTGMDETLFKKNEKGTVESDITGFPNYFGHHMAHMIAGALDAIRWDGKYKFLTERNARSPFSFFLKCGDKFNRLSNMMNQYYGRGAWEKPELFQEGQIGRRMFEVFHSTGMAFGDSFFDHLNRQIHMTEKLISNPVSAEEADDFEKLESEILSFMRDFISTRKSYAQEVGEMDAVDWNAFPEHCTKTIDFANRLGEMMKTFYQEYSEGV